MKSSNDTGAHRFWQGALSQPNGPKPSLAIIVLTCCLILVALTVHQLEFPLTIDWDDAVYLEQAQLLLAGKVPYVDFVEINPPMITYISAIPAMLSGYTNIHIIVCFKLFVLAISFLTTALCTALFWRRLHNESNWQYLAIILILISACGFLVGEDFGQREHLFVELYLPFFFLRWLRQDDEAVDSALAITCGVLATIGLCLKPVFLFFPLLTESYWLIASRDWRKFLRIEVYAATVAALAYCLHFLFIPQSMRVGFFEMASHFRWYQEAYGRPMLEAIFISDVPFLFFGIFGLTLFGVIFRRSNSLAIPLILFILASWLSYIAQGKCWAYHRIPLKIGFLLLFATESAMIWRWLVKRIARLPGLNQRIDAEKFENSALWALASGCCLGFILFCSCRTWSPAYALSIRQDEKIRGDCLSLQRELKRLSISDPFLAIMDKYSRPRDKILVINSGASPAYPAIVQANRSAACRYPHLFLIAGLEAAKADSRKKKNENGFQLYQSEEKQVLENVLDDVDASRPALIIIMTKAYRPKGFSFLKLLEDTGVADRLLKDYKLLAVITDDRKRLKLADVYQRVR